MNHRAAFVLSAVLAGVALLVGWLAFGWKVAPNPAASAADRARAEAVAGAGGAQLDAPGEPALEAARGGNERAQVEHDEHALATPADDSELAAANWVTGRLELAAGTPLDEEAWVVARGREFERRPLHRARVGPDGRFRVAFAAGTHLGWLELSARYNYIDEQGGIRPEKPPADLVLKGRLGGCVRGGILLPADAQEFAADVRQGRVSGGNEQFDFFGFKRTPGTITEDLRYEVGGLEPGAARSVMLEARGFIEASLADVEITPGGVSVRDLPLQLGSRFAGRVVGQDGRALADVKVKADLPGRRDFEFFGKTDSDRTDAEGRFELVGVHGGDVSIVALKSGFEPLVRALGPTPAGTRKLDLELVLDTGLSIAGQVQFADGRPAARALLTVEGVQDSTSANEIRFLDPEPVEADAGGAFTISGLKPGSYTLTAKAWVDPGKEEPLAADAGDRPRKVRKLGTPWSGRVERIAAGTAGAVVLLAKGDTIRGRVLDSDGKPVERFIVYAEPDTSSPGYTSEIEGIERAFHDADGRFALDGLRACGWKVHVGARGLLASSETEITVPGQNRDLAFKLLRLARVAGVVLDPDRKPVARAKVSCASDGPGWRYDATPASMRTNEKGEFDLRNVPLGAVRLSTEAPGFAPSVPVEFEIGPGAARTGLELVLSRGGSIRGVVAQADGSGEAGRPVSLSGASQAFEKRATSDAQGAFLFERLPPGTYVVRTAETRAEMMARFRALSADAAVSDEEPRSLRATVEVRDGQTVDVRLCADRAAPIRMHGKVSAPGAHAARIAVAPFADDGSDNVHHARIGEDGTYQVWIGARGSRKVTVMDAESRTLRAFQVDVPAGAEFERDFSVPGGSIRGRVVDLDQKPVAGVSLIAARGSHRDVLDDVDRYETQSAPDGTFAFEHVADGTYAVESNGGERWWEADRQATGHARASGVVVKDAQAVEGVELVLARGGTIAGSVRGVGGELLPGVEIFAFDSSGHRFARHQDTASDSGARFTIPDAPAGRILLYARSRNSAGKAVAMVRADGPAEVDIVLHPCADLSVRVLDAAGQPIFGGLEVVDEDGRHFEEVPQAVALDAAATGARSFRSLPSGSYTVRAFGPAGAIGEKQVRASPGASAEAVLRAAQ